MKRLSILAVVPLLAGLLGVVAGASPAAASEGPLTLTVDAIGSVSGTRTLTYGEGLSMTAEAQDPHQGCYTALSSCTYPTGTVDFWSQLGDPWVDGAGAPPHTKLSGDNALIPVGNGLNNDVTGEADADGGIYCCLHPGQYTIRGFYVPGNFDATSDDTFVDVNKFVPTTTLTASPTSSALGQSVTFTVSVSRSPNRLAAGPTKSVTIEEGPVGATVQYGTADLGTDGTATITTSQLSGGMHSLRAVYAGDDNYASTQGTLSYTVSKGSVTSTLSAPATSTYGQAVTLTDTIAPVAPATATPTGSVTFSRVGGTIGSSPLNTLSPDQASVTTTALPAGSQTIQASYAGDASYASRLSNQVTVTVAKAHTTTTVITSGSPSTLGDSVTFTAGVVGDYNTAPTGAVQFKDGVSDLGPPQTLFSGHATLTLSGLTGGAHTITAVYAGDTNHDGSTSAPLTQTVTCDRVVTGSVPTVTASGTTCLSGATVSGNVSVPAGAKLSLVNSHVSGVISTARGAGPIAICGTSVGGNITITGATGFVLIGDTVEDACAANSLGGSVTLSSNSGGLQLGFNRIGGNLTVNNNVGAGPAPAHTSPEIEANRIGGSLSCSGNSPVASDDGRPNSVSGARSGECASKTF